MSKQTTPKKAEQPQVTINIEQIKSVMGDYAKITDFVDKAVSATKQAHSATARALVAVVIHAHETGDVRLMTRLAQDIANYGGRRNAVIAFCEAYGPVSYDGKEKKFRHRKARRIEGFIESEQLLKMLEEAPVWHKMAPDPEYKPFNALEQTEKFVKRVINRASEQTEKDVIPDTLLSDLLDLAARHNLKLPEMDSREDEDEEQAATKQESAKAEAARKVYERSATRETAKEAVNS